MVLRRLLLQEELHSLKNKEVLSESWLDYFESWASLLALRSLRQSD